MTLILRTHVLSSVDFYPQTFCSVVEYLVYTAVYILVSNKLWWGWNLKLIHQGKLFNFSNICKVVKWHKSIIEKFGQRCQGQLPGNQAGVPQLYPCTRANIHHFIWFSCLVTVCLSIMLLVHSFLDCHYYWVRWV